MPLPANATVAVDVALVTVRGGEVLVLLHRRPAGHAAGEWALPGVFIRHDEALEDAAERALRDKAQLEWRFLEQLFSFGAPGRDPRGRVIAVAHYALVPFELISAALDAPDDELMLAAADHLPELAFDHAQIIALALERLRGKLSYSAVGYALLPEEFTLRQLRDVHETILGRRLNKDSFRRRMLESGELEPTGERERGVANRPAEYYRRVRGRGGG